MDAGSDTNSSITIVFVNAVTRSGGNVQRHAQKGIDSIVGKRPPLWSDCTRLPYVAQTVKEAMQWRPVEPLDFLHALTKAICRLGSIN